MAVLRSSLHRTVPGPTRKSRGESHRDRFGGSGGEQRSQRGCRRPGPKSTGAAGYREVAAEVERAVTIVVHGGDDDGFVVQ